MDQKEERKWLIQNIFQELKVEDQRTFKDMVHMSVTGYKFVLISY